MSVVAIIIGVVLGIGAWWWRVQRARDATASVIDFASHARGAYNRARFKQKSGASVLSSVEDAGTAAATLMYALATLKGPVMRVDEELMDKKLEQICGLDQRERDDAIAFGAWASAQVADVNEIIRRFKPLWRNALAENERKQLIEMAIDVAGRDGPPNDAQRSSIKRLSEDLLLTP